MRESFARPGFLRLRVGKGDPDLIHFVFGKTEFNEIDTRSEKSNILHFLFQRLPGPGPDSVAFNVNADKIFLWMLLCKPNAVLPSSAAKLENKWVFIFEIFFPPFSFQGKTF